MRNWMISQFQGILLRSCTIGILSRFSEVIKQLESKHLNILKTFLIYWCKTFCYFLLLFFFFFKPVTTQNFELVSDVQKVSSKIRAGSYQFSFLIVLLQVSKQWSFVVNDMRGWCLRSVLCPLSRRFLHIPPRAILTVCFWHRWQLYHFCSVSPSTV